jgi:hypothetical protein
MGKVGSSSIYRSIKEKFPYANIFHVHFLTENGLKSADQFHNVNMHTHQASLIKKVVKENPSKTIKIITVVREPLARDISDMFQNMETYMKKFGLNEINVDKLIESFNDFDFEYTQEWLETELKSYFDIDVYKIPFPHDKKYLIVKKNGIELLLLRLEDLNTIFTKAMIKYTGVKFEIIKANIGEKKSYARYYQTFIEKVPITRELFDRLYNTKYAKHFYTEKEINSFKEKWLSIKNQ